MKSIENLTYLIIIPLIGGLYLKLSHIYSEGFIADRFLPYLISLGLLIYLGRQHLRYWDKSFFRKPYLPLANLLIIVCFIGLQTAFLVTVDLRHWYSGLINRSASFYIFPFIFSGYVVPFLMFSHVLADSLDYSKRIFYIGSAILIIIVCFIFWWVKTGIV